MEDVDGEIIIDAIGDGEVENGMVRVVVVIEGAVEDSVDAGARDFDGHAFADAAGSAGPARIDEVAVDVVLFDLVSELGGVLGGVQREEGGAVAG